MSDARDRIRAQMEGLTEELRTIPATSWNHGRIADRRQGLVLLQMQLAAIEARHQAFLNYRATLAARFFEFSRKGGR